MYCICSVSDDEDDIEFALLNTPREKKIKIALLGPSDSGKSTIIKQLRHLTESYVPPDMKQMVEYIQESIITNMVKLCEQSMILEQSDERAAVHKSIRYLRDEMLSLREPEELNPEIVFKIRELWHDSGIQFTLQQRQFFQIDDNVDYFMNKLDVIADADYVPDFEDNVHIQRRSIGYEPTRFMKWVPDYGEYFFEIMDVGGCRTERKKWWTTNLLEDSDLTAIVYTVPLSDYNLTLYEDNKTNRLLEAINLFKEVMVKGKFFGNKPLFLLFNKYDLFLDNIKKIPITHCFKDFPDQMDPNDAAHVLKFIASKFLEVFKENDVELKQPLRILRTTAVDEANVEEVFDKIMPKIVKQNIVNFSDIDSDDNDDNDDKN